MVEWSGIEAGRPGQREPRGSREAPSAIGEADGALGRAADQDEAWALLGSAAGKVDLPMELPRRLRLQAMGMMAGRAAAPVGGLALTGLTVPVRLVALGVLTTPTYLRNRFGI